MSPEQNPEDEPMPEYHELSAEAFEDDWRAWLENPPVDWAPPKGTARIYTSTLDMRKEGQFVVRFDAWIGEAGIHVHARTVMFAIAPVFARFEGYVKKRVPWYAFWKKPVFSLEHAEERVADRKIISKQIVASFVIPWGVWAAMEAGHLKPGYPPKRNGHGGKPDPEKPWRQKPE